MKFILFVVIILLISSLACATPFLVCDKPTDQVDKYTGKVDGVSFETPFSLHPKGDAIVYNMEGMDLTIIHNFSDIRACNVMGCSTPGTSFSSPTRPSAPVNLKFVN